MRIFFNCLFVLSFAFYPAGAFAQNKKKGNDHGRVIDSLLKLLKTDKEDSVKVLHLCHLSRWFEVSGNFEKGSAFGKEALTLASHLNFKPGIAKANNNLGNILLGLGNYPEALKDHFKALKLFEELGYKKDAAGSYNNIGLIYSAQGNYPEALKNYLLALKLKKESGDKRAIPGSYNNIGNIYFYQGKYDEAMINYSKALELRKELGDKLGIATSYTNIGSILYRKKNYADALKNYSLALKIGETSGPNPGIVSCLINIGTVQTDLRKYKDAKFSINRALQLCLKTGNKVQIESSYSSLAILDSASGDQKQAFEDYKLFIIYKDSLLNEESTKKTVQTQMQYEFDKKSTADSIKNAETAKQENLKHESEVHQQKIFSYGGGIGFLLMLIIAGISFRAYRQKQNANLIISHQKELVEEKQREILDSIHYAKRIQQALLPTEKYIHRNIERLNND